jgi:hypothetical protein
MNELKHPFLRVELIDFILLITITRRKSNIYEIDSINQYLKNNHIFLAKIKAALAGI